MKNYISYLLLVLLLSPAKLFAQTCPAVYEDKNGLVVIETENLNLPSGWQRKTAASNYTGSGYIDWTGAENFNKTGVGLIETTIRINKAGRYTFQWRNKVGIGTVLTEHNDTWLRFPDASDFYGQAGRTVYPYGSGKTPNPNGAGSGGWFKVYFNAGTTTWAWATRVSDRESLPVFVEFDKPGVYKLQISARSKGHLLDRIVMFHSSVSASTAQNLSTGETKCSGGTTPTPNRAPVVANAIPNQSATVGINVNYTFPSNTFTDADGDALTYRASLTSGSALPSWLSFNTGSRTFSGTPPSTGTFNIRVTATDGRGGQATDDFTLTVNQPSTSQQAVVSFTLMNAATNQEIKTLTNGEQLNLSTLPTRSLSIRANTNPGRVGSVVMVLSGTLNRTQKETGFPYSLFGDEAGNYNGWTPAAGNYTLRGTPYTGSGGSGTAGTAYSINFSVVDQTSTSPRVVSYSLINAVTNQQIKELTAGEQINLATLPTRNLNIRANTSPATVGSVVMRLTGTQTHSRTETGAPYALFGDNNGDYHNWTPKVGNYTLTGTTYSGAGGQGTAGTPYALQFTVIDRSNARFGIEDNAETAGLTVTTYPNPFVESFTIQVKGREEDKLPVTIYDAQGRQVLQLSDVKPDQLIRLDKNAPGLYLLQVGEGHRTKRHKLMKTQ
ncbi:putative secreted protein (Por secretion system target) [Larkinella arboricola]|uniref:Putative secreted protein (Por secretion system target) n=1 Tax=Larkinella arboricola TaxID=643671 RepID=A0A327X194_LARAB|nr:putative Ig domain-containing protein [Larkinella arboricola]RAK00156.1 putative secreted protein (Por secretion system target) [Larkinella arboricola]